MRLDVHRWIECNPQLTMDPFWSELTPKGRRAEPTGGSSESPLASKRTGRDAAPGLASLERHILEQVARVLRLDVERVDRLASFNHLGMDSVLRLELRHKLESSLGVRFSAVLLSSHPNAAALAEQLFRRSSDPPREGAVPHDTSPSPAGSESSLVRSDAPEPGAPQGGSPEPKAGGGRSPP
jgi:acyl carrier protein